VNLNHNKRLGNTIICKICGVEFYKSPSLKATYCSNKCYRKYLKLNSKKVTLICKNCGKEFQTKPCNIKRAEREGWNLLCSKKCKYENFSGQNNTSWKPNSKKEFTCIVCAKRFVTWAYRKRTKCCSTQCVGVYATICNKKKWNKFNKIETAIKQELAVKGFNFIPHLPIEGISVVDFYLPDYRIIIQCDGDYWHNLKDHKIRDIKQDFLYHFKGYKVFRFWEKDILKSPVKCVRKVQNFIERLQHGMS
jgi:very-short-patch-repair endonuclease